MAVTAELKAEILRLFHAEKWRKSTIARQLGIHHSTVARVLASESDTPRVFSKKSKVDPYIQFIKDTLAQYPKLNATRVYQMVKERGYSGGVDHFRDIVRSLRPRPKAESYLRLATLPGQQAQVDWGYFGKVKVGHAERRLLAFVLVVSWSRRVFLRFYYGENTANFLRGHVEAFAELQSVPREILYDNLKSAVLERVDSAIRFNPEILSLAAHYRFAAKPVPVARPTSKGRVERAIQYIRSSFFAAREFADIEDLNRQAAEWCHSEAQSRRCPQDRKLTVAEAFEQEKDSLLSLPETAFPVCERVAVRIGKTPYAQFDGNFYSVPHTHTRQTLVIEASLTTVRIIDGVAVVAEHLRTFDKGQLVEDSAHIDALVAEKRSCPARRGAAVNRIINVAPSSKAYFELAASRGSNMGRLTQLLLRLLEMYGAAELDAVLESAVKNGTVHSESIRSALEKRRERKGMPPAVPLKFAKDPRIDEIAVRPKSLDTYDKLFRIEEDIE